MKKILTLCAVVIAAMSLNAQTVMTCDAAYDAAIALNAGDTFTIDQVVVTVEVTAYVANENGATITDGCQTFYIGKSATETTKTIQVYKGVMPQGATALHNGDQVKVTGKLMHYVNRSGTVNVAELVNSTVDILQQRVVTADTVSDATVCEIISEGESLTGGSYSAEVYEIEAVIDSLSYTNASKMQQTFFLKCADNGKMVQIYNGVIDVLADNGDTVFVSGKIMHYVDANRNIVEFNGPNVKLVGKATVPPAVRVTVAQAVTIGDSLARGSMTKEDYMVVGYVDSIVTAYDSKYGNISFYMCDNMQNPTYNFEVYRGAYTADIPVGTLVYCTGKIHHYYKAAEGQDPEVELIELSNAKVSLSETALPNVAAEQKGMKVLENGQLYIIKDNVKYSVLGVEVK